MFFTTNCILVPPKTTLLYLFLVFFLRVLLKGNGRLQHNTPIKQYFLIQFFPRLFPTPSTAPEIRSTALILRNIMLIQAFCYSYFLSQH